MKKLIRPLNRVLFLLLAFCALRTAAFHVAENVSFSIYCYSFWLVDIKTEWASDLTDLQVTCQTVSLLKLLNKKCCYIYIYRKIIK